MKTFRFSIIPMSASVLDGRAYRELRFGMDHNFSARTVEAENLKALQPLFDAFCEEMAATGKPLHCSVRMGSNRDRKPPGFDKATGNGGSLQRDVNWDKAVAAALAEKAAKVAA